MTRKSSAIVPAPKKSLAERRPDLRGQAEEFANASLSAATRRAIKADWKVWADWCAANGVAAMPASVDAAIGFLVDMSKKAVATLHRYRASVGKLHKLAGHPSPFADARAKAVLEGIRRKRGVAQKGKKAMTIDLASAPGRSERDRAITLFGIATALRGDELCALDTDDVVFDEQGALVRVKRSKTDQSGKGRVIAVPAIPDSPEVCPVRALRQWLALLDTGVVGPLFRSLLRNSKPSSRRLSRQAVNKIVKQVAAEAGLNPREFGSHSLRSGYVTEARMAGLDWSAIMAQTGHKKVETVQRYDRGTIDPHKASRAAEVFRAAGERRRRR